MKQTAGTAHMSDAEIEDAAAYGRWLQWQKDYTVRLRAAYLKQIAGNAPLTEQELKDVAAYRARQKLARGYEARLKSAIDKQRAGLQLTAQEVKDAAAYIAASDRKKRERESRNEAIANVDRALLSAEAQALLKALPQKKATFAAGELRPCQWKDCGLEFQSAEDLAEHAESHIPGRGKITTMACKWGDCSLRLDSASAWRAHLLGTHCGTRPFKCPDVGCTLTFTTPAAVRVVSDSPAPKKAVCTILSESCNTAPQRSRHSRCVRLAGLHQRLREQEQDAASQEGLPRGRAI